MKVLKLFFLTVASAGLVLGTTSAQANPKPELVNLPPMQVFVPTGFDDNDNSQIVVHGEFTNTCFKVGPSEVTQDPVTGKIMVKNQAYYYDGCFCLFVLVPYDKVIDLGIMKAGKHDVAFDDGKGGVIKQASISVANAREGAGPDEFLYAPVSEMAVVKTPGNAQLELKGTFSNTCMTLKEVKVINKDPSVVEVLPVSEMATRSDCQEAKIPFIHKAPLPQSLTGRVLIHTRALSGKSLNLVSEF